MYWKCYFIIIIVVVVHEKKKKRIARAAHLGTRSQCFAKKELRANSFDLSIADTSETIDSDATEEEMQDSIRRILYNVLESDVIDRSSVSVEKRRESADSTAYTIRVENLAANTGLLSSNSPHVDIDYIQTAYPGFNIEPAIVSIGVRSSDRTSEQKIQVLTYPVEENPHLKAPLKKIIRIPEDSHTYLSFELVSDDSVMICASLISTNGDANATFTFRGDENDVEIIRPECDVAEFDTHTCEYTCTSSSKVGLSSHVLIRGSGASIRNALKHIVYEAQTPHWTGSDTISVKVQDSERTIYIVTTPINDPPRFEDRFSSSIAAIYGASTDVVLVPHAFVSDPDASVIRVYVKQPNVGLVSLDYTGLQLHIVNDDENDITFESNVENVNNALRALRYTAPGSKDEREISDTIVKIRISDEEDEQDELDVHVSLHFAESESTFLTFESEEIVFVEEDGVVSLPRLFIEHSEDTVLTVSSSRGRVTTNSSTTSSATSSTQQSFEISVNNDFVHFIYRPNPDFFGTDHVTVSVENAVSKSLTIVVTPRQDAPRLETNSSLTSSTCFANVVAYDADDQLAMSIYDVSIRCETSSCAVELIRSAFVHQIQGNGTSVLSFQCTLDQCNEAFRESVVIRSDEEDEVKVNVRIVDSLGLSDTISLNVETKHCQSDHVYTELVRVNAEEVARLDVFEDQESDLGSILDVSSLLSPTPVTLRISTLNGGRIRLGDKLKSEISLTLSQIDMALLLQSMSYVSAQDMFGTETIEFEFHTKNGDNDENWTNSVSFWIHPTADPPRFNIESDEQSINEEESLCLLQGHSNVLTHADDREGDRIVSELEFQILHSDLVRGELLILDPTIVTAERYNSSNILAIGTLSRLSSALEKCVFVFRSDRDFSGDVTIRSTLSSEDDSTFIDITAHVLKVNHPPSFKFPINVSTFSEGMWDFEFNIVFQCIAHAHLNTRTNTHI